MESYHVHYKNKYPGGQVVRHEDSLDVYDVAGNHVVALRKDGRGNWVDRSAEHGCTDRHDLSPIPKDSRVFKAVNGKIVEDNRADERKEKRKQFMVGGKVLSCKELEAKFEFDEGQRVRAVRQPAAKPVDPAL